MCSLFVYLTHISYLFRFIEMERRKRDRGLSSNEKHLFGHHSYKQTTLRETYQWLSWFPRHVPAWSYRQESHFKVRHTNTACLECSCWVLLPIIALEISDLSICFELSTCFFSSGAFCRFLDDLKCIALTILDRNKKRQVVYEYLNPSRSSKWTTIIKWNKVCVLFSN